MIEISNSSIGGRLEAVRKLRNISQVKMAEVAGVSRGTLIKVEKDETSLSVDSVLKIVKEFDISLEYLLTGADLLEKRKNKLTNIKHDTQIDSQIVEGCLVTTIKVPLFNYLG